MDINCRAPHDDESVKWLVVVMMKKGWILLALCLLKNDDRKKSKLDPRRRWSKRGDLVALR